MQAVVLILESDNNAEVKEQALCILANIADGDIAKSYIMTNEDVLKKITNYMMHTNTKLQMAAVICIYNLAFVDEPGSGERQARLKEVGVHKILSKLLTTSDPTLSEKAKAAHQQFAWRQDGRLVDYLPISPNHVFSLDMWTYSQQQSPDE